MNKEIEYLKKYLKDKDMETAIKELESGIPVQYIVGNVDFYGNTFKVNKNTLIPRFETELLVEKTIKYINKYFNNEIKILDIGTGSGCIAITLNKLLDNSRVTAVDISKNALDVARENNKINNTDVNFIESDVFSNINDKYDSNILTSRNISFRTPKFEYSGACAGCGETPYLTNLTRVFNDNLVIANATGCSSIYGGSTPSFPYSIPWASSLFEDNAEYGYGILNGINMKRDKIKKYMKEYPRNKVFKKWLNNMNNYDICKEVYKEIDYKKHPYLNDMKDYIVPKSMWIVGGDGFAYDIGYDGIDHVLSKNDNINIMVLDTEVYSNTGGQASKSSNYGATASFASSGKNNYKKDLARIAMCYPHVYVASCNIGYNNEQYLKALKEASSYDGPSIIICYSPCIEHGIKSGMEHSQSNAYLATECGYFITFRYNPSTGKLILDSKNPDFNKYEDYLMTENRFANLKNVNSDNANMILEEQKKWAMNRFNYYKRIRSSYGRSRNYDRW